MGEELQSRDSALLVGWIDLLTLVLDRRSIDLMAQMSACWRKWHKPMMNYVVR